MMSEFELLPRGTGKKITTAPANVISGLSNRSSFVVLNDQFLQLAMHLYQFIHCFFFSFLRKGTFVISCKIHLEFTPEIHKQIFLLLYVI